MLRELVYISAAVAQVGLHGESICIAVQGDIEVQVVALLAGAEGTEAKSEGVMTYAEYDAAALESEVVIETYVQFTSELPWESPSEPQAAHVNTSAAVNSNVENLFISYPPF